MVSYYILFLWRQLEITPVTIKSQKRLRTTHQEFSLPKYEFWFKNITDLKELSSQNIPDDLLRFLIEGCVGLRNLTCTEVSQVYEIFENLVRRSCFCCILGFSFHTKQFNIISALLAMERIAVTLTGIRENATQFDILSQ